MSRLIRDFILKTLLLLSLFAILLTACNVDFSTNQLSYTHFEERMGKDTMEVLLQPVRVTAANVSKSQDSHMMIHSEEKVLTPKQIKTLQKLLLEDKGYIFDRKKKCLFIPEVAFRFDNNKEVTVLVGMTCKQIQVIGFGKSAILDDDPIANELNAFCQLIKE